MSIVAFVAVAGVVLFAFGYFNKPAVQTAEMSKILMSKILQDISAGTSKMNFVLANSPLVVSEHEKVVAVLPKTILLEPRNVRRREGSRYGSSVRWSGYSSGRRRYTSTTQSVEQQQVIDEGMLVATDHRLVFLGAVRPVSIDLKIIMGVDQYPDGIGVHCTDKEKVETFRISNDLMLNYKEAQENISFPFTGPVLERLISRTVAASNDRRAAAAA